jgi:hypothetical protein
LKFLLHAFTFSLPQAAQKYAAYIFHDVKIALSEAEEQIVFVKEVKN